MDSTSWLKEEIWSGGEGTIPRRRMIWRFTKYGLSPFLKAHGYIIGVTNHALSSGIATLLYYNRSSTLTGLVNLNERNDYSIEHKQHYNHVISHNAWNALWKEWSFWEDVDDIGLGFYRRLDIQEYSWAQLNLDSSPQTKIVEEFIEGGDEVYVSYRDEHEDS